MSSASKLLLLVILFLLQTSIATRSKLLKRDMLQFSGNFLKPDSAQKLRETSKQWSDVKIYENVFPKESMVAVLKKVNTEEILWETIQFTELWKRVPRKEELVSYLCRNDSAKWKDVFLWITENDDFLDKIISQNNPFLKKLMPAIAETVAVTFKSMRPSRFNQKLTALHLAAEFDHTDSILTLIKRGAEVNQPDDSGWRALHRPARYRNVSACAALLKNNAKIDATAFGAWTPLMIAASFGKKNAFEFLIENGADETLTDIYNKTAWQRAEFEER
jgi:hypothetical protein